jgi:hypothetical protein
VSKRGSYGASIAYVIAKGYNDVTTEIARAGKYAGPGGSVSINISGRTITFTGYNAKGEAVYQSIYKNTPAPVIRGLIASAQEDGEGYVTNNPAPPAPNYGCVSYPDQWSPACSTG